MSRSLKEIFGIGSIGKFTNPTHKYIDREKLGIWLTNKHTGQAGLYLCHINSGTIVIRNDYSNPFPNHAGTDNISKKDFFKNWYIEEYPYPPDVLSEVTIFI